MCVRYNVIFQYMYTKWNNLIWVITLSMNSNILSLVIWIFIICPCSSLEINNNLLLIIVTPWCNKKAGTQSGCQSLSPLLSPELVLKLVKMDIKSNMALSHILSHYPSLLLSMCQVVNKDLFFLFCKQIKDLPAFCECLGLLNWRHTGHALPSLTACHPTCM